MYDLRIGYSNYMYGFFYLFGPLYKASTETKHKQNEPICA